VINTAGAAHAQGKHELNVHVAQANNNSPYTFVRAKFMPGELSDPWAVRFFDAGGHEIPYFVWDSITWEVAREGRADWGHRYALLNHGPGDSAEVRAARAEKLQWTAKNLPETASRLAAQEQAALKAPDSVCAALYLLRHGTPALGKERLTLRLFPKRQVQPERRAWKEPKATERVTVGHKELKFCDLPDRLSVVWNGKELFRAGGFHAGGWQDTTGHADPARPFKIETVEGIVTKIALTGETNGRQGSAMGWQSTYWLFPEGGFVGLEGFNLSDPAGYLGGPQKLSIWQVDGDLTQRRAPAWDTPWWVHQAGERGFVATHLFHATPLTIGYGNNPFTVNAEGADKDPRIEVEGNRLALRWLHRIDDPAILRLMIPQPLPRPGTPKPAAKPALWQPKVDWLYRQYVMGLGGTAKSAERSLREVLGAAAGWIDRPVREEEVAALLVAAMPRITIGPESSEIGLLKLVPAVLAGDQPAVRSALSRAKDPIQRTDYYINLIRRHVERGGKASEGKKKDDPDGTPREGWTGNPCYHAALMPCYVRVLEHFDLPFPQKETRQAIVRYADFSLEILGGTPPDLDKLNATLKTEWPSRVVPIIPLMLHAYTLKPDENYARTAKMLFADLERLVKRNPHGYFPAWTFAPKADKYDTVYNPVSYERGIAAFWSEGMLEMIGRDEASKFTAAQARWFVFSGQLLDTLEVDNSTAIRATTHGGHTGLRNQIGIYLYDDFAFYRGLVGDLVTWSAAASQVPGHAFSPGVDAYRGLELSNAGSSMLRWALAIRPGSKWAESKIERRPDRRFRLQAWNRLPRSRPAVKVTAEEVGLQAKSDVLTVELQAPAFREPAVFEVTGGADNLALRVTSPAKVRLAYRALRPQWPAQERPVLEQRRTGAPAEAVKDAVWDASGVEWQAVPGEYQLRLTSK
jgi:hypothetical protein